MLFRRRKKLGPLERLRLLLWPQKSHLRSFQYFTKRILRLNATPHAIAAGVAAGVLASWTPFVGFHLFVAFAIAYAIAGNMIAAGIGTFLGNPFTFPFIWAATYKLGHHMLDSGQNVDGSHIDLIGLVRNVDFGQLWGPIIKPMLIGCLPLGIVSGVIFYGLTFWSVRTFQERRRRMLAASAERRRTASPAPGAASLPQNGR